MGLIREVPEDEKGVQKRRNKEIKDLFLFKNIPLGLYFAMKRRKNISFSPVNFITP